MSTGSSDILVTDKQTDRQTDRQTDKQTQAKTLSPARKAGDKYRGDLLFTLVHDQILKFGYSHPSFCGIISNCWNSGDFHLIVVLATCIDFSVTYSMYSSDVMWNNADVIH